MKLTVIGGGGVRSMFLAKSIAQRADELHIDSRTLPARTRNSRH